MTSESEADGVEPERDWNELPTAAIDSNPATTDHDLEATVGPEESGIDSSSLMSPPSQSAQLLQLDGYQLQEELGRGGMGVVYRARHKQLDRIVAIKMILAGQFASPESVARFQLEAETAAKLDHPGIVPIYEIGQAGEHHFYSMKLIDGSPLSALLVEFQPDQRKSAELMIKIAEAVQHAHQRGVLHRDLKPANVLIDQHGQPLLTDLGLAKQLDNDSSITQTGLVLGSPGYMSPEQAAGKTDVTVAVDVYALGAILYWLIAGRPPITGESAFDVVRKTIEYEPQSVREIRVDADRDLNLICTKAIQKDPEERYASADDFAADLRAWLDGDPLSVKPPTWISSTRRWAQKNFRGVAVGVGAGILCGLWLGFTVLFQIADRQLDTASSLNEQLQAADPPWITQALGWVKLVPSGLQNTLQAWITVVTASCGIATIGLSKPKQGDTGAAAALTAALLSGIFAFVISWAWSPIANRAQQASQQDLQLLTDYLFLHPDDRHLVEQVLSDRYPGLQQSNTWQRSDLMRAKIASDQTGSIPAAIWTGLVVTVFIAALPVFVSSLLASIIWHRDHRNWAFLWRSMEISFYATTLIFLLCRSWSDLVSAPPLLRFQAFSTAVMLLAIFVALKRKPFWWRLPLLFAVLISYGLNINDSSKVTRAKWIAQSANSDPELTLAVPYLERNIAYTGDRESQFSIAMVYAYLGENEKYRQVCKELLDHGNFYQRKVAEQAAKAILIRPDLHNDMSQAHQLARWASEQQAYNGWDYLCRSLSEYRQGNWEQSLSWADRSREVANSQNIWQKEVLIATGYLIKALTHQSRGELERSEQSRQEAEKTLVRNLKISFENRLTYDMLTDELAQ